MKFLGLDPGLRTGWALYDQETDKWTWGTWELGYHRPLARLSAHLFGLGVCGRVTVEKPIGAGFRAMSANSEKVGIVRQWAGESETFRLVAPTTVKKFATGYGRASKEEMIAAARKRWGPGVKTEHEADALWICAWGITRVEAKK